MKYYFLTGRNYDLSKAELLTLLPQYCKEFSLEYIGDLIIIVKTDVIENPNDLFERLGGFMSYGELIDLDYDFQSSFEQSSKVVFGINAHGDISRDTEKTVKSLGESIKEGFINNGKSAKFIIAKDLSINGIEAEKNKLLEKGFILELFYHKDVVYYGLAKAVQDIKSFSLVEYEKPFTDKQMGVLPAKLARIMLNLAGLRVGETVWDPFCGSGTILLEGFRQKINVIGSDVDKNAVDMSNQNIGWYGTLKGDVATKYKLFHLDILKPDKKTLSLLRKTTINGLVCEPFMGPPQLRSVPFFRAKRFLESVKKLYSNLFIILEHLKLHNFTAVIVIPSYKTNKGWVTVSISEIVSKKWKVINKSGSGHLQWSRSDSIIRRNIFVLYKKN